MVAKAISELKSTFGLFQKLASGQYLQRMHIDFLTLKILICVLCVCITYFFNTG